MGFLVLLGIVIVIFIVVFMTCIRIVPQTKECIVERLGKYNGTLHAGFNTIAPFIDRVIRVVSTVIASPEAPFNLIIFISYLFFIKTDSFQIG